jgi:thiamine pyrophosphate-dependent acetolactate synthase large subunit-like protein
MPVSAALRVLVPLRQHNQIVVTNQGSAREWLRLSQHPLDFHYIPSAMGGAVPLGLGLALALPDREVWVLTGDGSLLMNLGCLVSVADSGVTNLTVLLVDNGVYEVTGGQKTAASRMGVDFAAVARAAGLRSVFVFREIVAWRDAAAEALQAAGPRFLWLVVQPVRADFVLHPPCPIGEQLDRLINALATRPL